MQASSSSPPFIFDSDMPGGRLDSDPDFEFFDSTQAANSPEIFLAEDFATDNPSQYLNFGSPNPANHKSPLPAQATLLDTRVQHPLSAPSTVSPGGSSEDSASESSGYKRKSSSDSSRSVLTPGDTMMGDDTDMGDPSNWKTEDLLRHDETIFGQYNGGTIDPSEMNNNFGFNDKSMDDSFDFESAASSPSPFGLRPVDMESPEMPTMKYDTPANGTPALKKFKNHNKRSSQHSITQSMTGLTTSASREASPLSAMVTSQENSPSAFFTNSPSPATGVEFVSGQMLNGIPQNSNWAAGFQNFHHGLPNMQQGQNTVRPPQQTPGMTPGQQFPNMNNLKPMLTIHPTPLKSRVETQIPIKMTLFPLPPGISKLHLPTHTISKPKLLAKPAPERSPDTLELYTTLVCTSAMMDPATKQRAFERAANPSAAVPEASSPDSGSDEDDENKPLNGGDVKICTGCITRERKRAARKKVKKVEEEEIWHLYEAQRVVVFNTHEIKDWQVPTSQLPSDLIPDRQEPFVPEGAMQVDAPMRIACYCRHQNEKVGFSVIFTIKDYQDRLIAQAMTSSIMITDDHKTHLPPTLTNQSSNGSDSQLYNGPGSFPIEGNFDMSGGSVGGMTPFGLSHSSSDLQGLQNNPNTFNLNFQPPMSNTTTSHTTSATMTPRNSSRQTSPSAGNLGPMSKKRKASSSGKVPSGLAMTRLESAQATPGQSDSSVPMSTSTSAAVSPFTPNLHTFPPVPEQQFGQVSANIGNIPQQFNTGPPTPNDQPLFSGGNRSLSMDNLAMQQLYSASTSAHPSRAPSPNGLRNAQAFQQQAQVAQAVANGLYGIPLGLNPHMPPTIHKLIPNEGPTAGGIEVTCLGRGFCQGLEVMFGDVQATTTTYWGDASLVCLLPPSAFAGTVPVTFKHQHKQPAFNGPPIPKQHATFKYVNDDEQQLIRTALVVLGQKMTGKMEDVRDLARRIVDSGNNGWGASAGQSPPGGGSNQQNSAFNAANLLQGGDVETTILKCFDLIDLDDSPNLPKFNLRRASGQTMLHLACSLGYNRVVAALLARGVNPDPRDKGGYTPLHFAALHDHPQIVRRLMLVKADSSARTLQGYTPSDLTKSDEVIRALRRDQQHHSRTRSGSSLKSRTSSATSLRSVWEPNSAPTQVDDSSEEDDEYDDEYEDEDEAFYMKSRRSTVNSATSSSPEERDPVLELPTINAPGAPSPGAAMTAFRDQFTAHIQQFQQTMHHLNLPNLPQMPRFDMNNLPDYQAYIPTAPMVRRISNLVGNNRPDGSKEQDYKWWDLFSGNAPAAPPAYEEIYPQGELDVKRASAEQAAADTVADNKCSAMFDQVETETSPTEQEKSVILDSLRVGQKHVITREVTREQQDQLRMAHAEKVKRLSRDRNLFFIWIPLLIIICLAMLCNRVPQVWTNVAKVIDAFRIGPHNQGRFVEV